jgi:hypothetical protein
MDITQKRLELVRQAGRLLEANVCMMRHLLLLISLLTVSCSAQPERTGEPWNETLKTELLTRVADDQAVRERFSVAMRAGGVPDTALIRELQAIDSANTEWLRVIVDRHGWPERDVVGADGASAAFLIVQHADRDTAIQTAMLPALAAAFRRGQAEGQSVALLTDRLAVARGEPQVYGSQASITDGRVIFAPIADSAGVDARRAEMGLPSLSEYRRVLDSVYLGRRVP